MDRLKGKVAIVTGSTSGIGVGIAKLYAAEGAKVVICGRRAEKGQAVVDEIAAAGGEAYYHFMDMTQMDSIDKLFADTEEKYGKIDILVNNAGITRDNLIMKMKEEDFDAVIQTNLKGTFNTIRHLSRQMLKQRSGKIINISSASGILGNAGQANYAASKAGVIGLTKTMARELASRGITVNAVAPGFVDTEMTAVLSEEIKENACKQIPLGKFGKPEDIANMVAFLASEKADYITGQVISVDGGMNM